MSWSSTQKYLAEFLGTFALLLFGGGSAVFTMAEISEGFARVIIVSLSFGFVLMGLAYAFGDISGGHFNPAVTLSMAITKRMPTRDVIPYLVAQIVGGIIGIAVVWGIVNGSADPAFIHTVQANALGSQCYNANSSPCGFSLGSVFLIEAALTFVFVLVIQLVTRPENSAKNLAPMAIGGALMVGNLVAIPVDGASMNPVRSFSPALLSSGWSSGMWAIDQSWLFWVAPIVGGILAGLVAMALRPRE
ncbi:MAG: aquaporin [Thermoplasmata archaeon]|nr:aquaporin [Thermoplasmata archaeon]